MDHYGSVSTYDASYGVLEFCLKDILSLIKPSEHDQLKRWNTIHELTTRVRSMPSLRGVDVRPFGSFVSNLYTKWGDLDISVELSNRAPSSTSKACKQNVLRHIMRVLRKTGVAQSFHFIAHARVPLLIFESNRHNISCDISIDNHLGYVKSKILLWISEIDERFRDMVLLTKEWAKAQNINDPKSGTLNSYSLCLLVIFYFQTCQPPILPPLKDIYPGNIVDIKGSWSNLERQIEDTCAQNIARFKFSRKRNKSSLCHLLISFFDWSSNIKRFSSAYAICTYTGQWEKISSNPRWMEKSYSLIIEDPFEQPDNAARSVGLSELSMIFDAFQKTYQKLSSNSVLSDRDALLSSLVRSNISSRLMVGTHNSTAHVGNGNRALAEFSGYATHAPLVEDRAEVGFCGVITNAPIAKDCAQVEFSDYTTHTPLQDRFQSVLKLDGHCKPSPSTIPMQKTEVRHVQKWRPRHLNR